MSIELIVPKYKHRPVSLDEKIVRKVANPMDPDDLMPHQCGICGVKGTFKNPLMGRPYFTFEDTGRPKGELYQVMCAECMERKAGKR